IMGKGAGRKRQAGRGAGRNADYAFLPNVDLVMATIHLQCNRRCERTRRPMTSPEMSWIFDTVEAGMSRYTSPKNRVHSGNLTIPVINERRKVTINPQSMR
ncbi:MAG: hypothetical protein NTX30_07055, partial [Deltaproteobacteria bacterium]|nr:hypothetical protein [Deltaproteobacteria bacterium]